MNNEAENLICSSKMGNKEEQVGCNPAIQDNFCSDREAKYYHLFEYAPCAVFQITTNGKIATVNRMAAELVGYSRAELLCMEWTSIFPPDRPGNNAMRSKFRHSGEVYSGEGEIKSKGKGYTSVAVSSKVMEDGSNLVFVKDITELKKAENLLKASELRYKDLNSTKDKFFSIIAHDLKSPFSTIMGFSSILSEQVRKKEYDGIEEYATIIEDASTRAMELLRNLLEWSRSQTGRMTFSPEPLDLGLLIRDTAEHLKDAAMHKGITVSLDVPVGLFCKADRPMVGSVLRNFISNAIKFTHPRGSIVVCATQKLREVVVEVRDTGVGIAKMNLHKLFRMDEAFSTSGTRNEKGTGLGLLLSKEFIEKHGGNIWVESEPGMGSSFFFSIPEA